MYYICIRSVLYKEKPYKCWVSLGFVGLFGVRGDPCMAFVGFFGVRGDFCMCFSWLLFGFLASAAIFVCRMLGFVKTPFKRKAKSFYRGGGEPRPWPGRSGDQKNVHEIRQVNRHVRFLLFPN